MIEAAVKQKPLCSMFLNCSFPTGLNDYINRYSGGISRVVKSFGPVPDFDGEQAQGIVKVRATVFPDCANGVPGCA